MDMTLSVMDDQSGVVFCPEEWTEEPAGRSVYMYVVFEREQEKDQYVLTDPENSCREEILLAPSGQEGDTIYISFGGILSESDEWKSGELAIDALYTMSAEAVTDAAAVTDSNGILRAPLPDAEIINAEEMLWSWTVEAGIQAYEYTFWQEETEISRGRINVEEGQVAWNWSEGLAEGDYELNLKAIGDNIYFLNSETGSYTVTVCKDILQPTEEPEENKGSTPAPTDEAEENESSGTGTPQPTEDMGAEMTPQPLQTPGEDEREPISTPAEIKEETTPQPSQNPDENDSELLPSPESVIEDNEENPQTTENAEEKGEEKEGN